MKFQVLALGLGSVGYSCSTFKVQADDDVPRIVVL